MRVIVDDIECFILAYGEPDYARIQIYLFQHEEYYDHSTSSVSICGTQPGENLLVPGFQWHEPTAWSPMGVPTANDSVLINGLTFVMPDSTAYARYVFVGPSGTLDIQRDIPTNTPGKLFIANSPTAGLENEGSVTNGGRIDIDNSGTLGLWNNGTFEILSKAKLNIDSCISTGISSGSTAPALLDNYGTINISRAPSSGLTNYDSLHNHVGA